MFRILGNIHKVAFWTLAYLAYDPALLNSIRAEGNLAVKDGQLDEQYLTENCPLLDSFIDETLRLTVASALVRDIIEPTHIGGKTLQPGSKILVCIGLIPIDLLSIIQDGYHDRTNNGLTGSIPASAS